MGAIEFELAQLILSFCWAHRLILLETAWRGAASNRHATFLSTENCGRLSHLHSRGPIPHSGLQTRMTADQPATETTINNSIHLVGICIEAFGVLIIVAGIIWSTYRYIHWGKDGWNYDRYRIRLGRSLLLGLELLVAADIVKTIAIELTFTSLGLLAGLVLVRTFLSWTLVLEIEGRWPWAKEVVAPEIMHQSGK